MDFSAIKDVAVSEYTSLSITSDGPKIPLNPDTKFSFNGIKLSYATARAWCSAHLDDQELWFDTMSAAFGLTNFIEHGSQNLKLKRSRIERLRDFSKTSRIGEAAQGIAYLYAQEKLLYPIITDFHLFAAKNSIAIPAGSMTPDFVLQKRKLTRAVSLIESKGTIHKKSRKIKNRLQKGLLQCESGKDLLEANGFHVLNKIVACTEFSDDSSIDTRLHIADPEDQNMPEVFFDHLMRIHYASWFYLIADFDNVEKLVNNKNIDFNSSLFRTRVFNNEEYYCLYFSSFRKTFLPRILEGELIETIPLSLLFFQRGKHNVICIGISKKIINHLIGAETLAEIPNFNIEVSSIDKNNDNENAITYLFTDGVIISVNNA